tara:strand:+ start:280 stop:450 length:171 start_codon:yes stop_codon:yes gene_type:complete
VERPVGMRRKEIYIQGKYKAELLEDHGETATCKVLEGGVKDNEILEFNKNLIYDRE